MANFGQFTCIFTFVQPRNAVALPNAHRYTAIKLRNGNKKMASYDRSEVESIVADKVFHYMMHAATRDDVSSLRQETKAELVRLETKIDAAVERLEAKIDRLEARIDRLEAKIDKVEAKIDKVLWGFVGITGAILTAVAVQVIVHFVR